MVIVAFVMGAIVGSFLNVCIHRIPLGESILWPSSHCPACKKLIRAYDNIPLLSFVLLGARCRACGVRIPSRYFWVELLSALTAAMIFARFPEAYYFFKFFVFAGVLIVLSFIDLEHMIVPDAVSLPAIALGAVFSSFGHGDSFYFSLPGLLDSIFGIIAGGVLIIIMGTVGEFIFKKEAMGGGDIRVMALVGAFLGLKLMLLAFFLAPVIGAGFGLYARVRHKKDVLPYVPYISAAALLCLLFGNEILGFIFPSLS
jgi:leader peptidase (prepilin peptidase)/N-methyltransferase